MNGNLDKLAIKNYSHKTWANTFKCSPTAYFQPETIEQVQEIVKDASSKNLKVNTFGAGHSPSILTMTDDYLVNIDKLNKVLKLEQHNTYSDITVEAGIRLKDVNELLAKKNLALQNLGSISEQSIAGVISTGTHGSSYCHGLISEMIVSLDLVTEDGELITVNESSNSELFKAVLLGLGAFGIIVRATIRCVPAFNVKSNAYVLGVDELLDDKVWKSIFEQDEFHRIWWYPYTDKVYVWRASRTSEPVQAPLYSFYGTRLGRLLYETLLWVSVKVFPSLTPRVESWLFGQQFDDKVITTHVGRSDQEINMDCLFKQFVNEWSMPLNNGPQMVRELRDAIWKRKFYVHAPIEIRASNTTLPDVYPDLDTPSEFPSTIYGNITRPLLDPSPKLPYAKPGHISNDQLTLNMNATMYRPFGCDPKIDKWFETFEKLAETHGGKPHWAKNFIRNPWVRTENAENVAEWKRLRNKYSPKQTFGNEAWYKEKELL